MMSDKGMFFDYGPDIYTEADGQDDTLANLGPLRPLAAGDLVLFRRELRAPLGVGLGDLGDFDGADELALFVEDFEFHDAPLRRMRLL